MGTLLDTLSLPDDVARLETDRKIRLADEIRDRIVRTVASNGGHLASPLGVVELTIAILSRFRADRDKVVWDVGHQAYAWKILTDRRDAFPTLRTRGGLSGFPNREESRFDCFGVGHSSTSISAALGMAMARDLSDDPAVRASHVVAVIGDGAMTAGMAYEALNQAGAMRRRLIVVLNDNEMSISRNVGALSLFLSRNMERHWARRVRREISGFLRTVPAIGEDLSTYMHRAHRSLKNVFTPGGMLFEALGFNYIGPVDGHDIEALERHLDMAASIDEMPVLLHVLTRKGKGYAPAERNPAYFHGIGKFDMRTGVPIRKPDAGPSWTAVFAETLTALAAEDRRIVAVTAAMADGTGTETFRKAHPDRFVDVGICEQHAVTFAAGLAASGLRPFVAVYSTFAQRAYDQILHDVALQNLPVTLCLDRAGLVGEDGATHHGSFDLAFLRPLPNMRIVAPRDATELQRILCMAPDVDAPLAIRYPRGAATGTMTDIVSARPEAHAPDRGDLVLGQESGDILIIAVGSMAAPAMEAAAALNLAGRRTSVFDPWWSKPLPERHIARLAASFGTVLVAEEGMIQGGVGESVQRLLAGRDVIVLGIPDTFVPHGPQGRLRHELGLDAEGILKALEGK